MKKEKYTEEIKNTPELESSTKPAIDYRTCYVAFLDEDFSRFQNMVSVNKYYYYAEKKIGDYTVEVNGGKYRVHFDVEIIKNQYGNVIARGSYKSLNDLNIDLEKWIKVNLINATTERK
jgi:hypothetical protein